MTVSLVTLSMQAQPRLQYFSFPNPSFEGSPASPFDSDTWGIIPPDWKTCQGGSTPDIQPGAWGVDTPPSKGKSYVSIICREDGTFEDIGQNLNQTLKRDSIYYFSLDLAFNDAAGGTSIRTPNVLRIWGTGSGCDRKDLIWTSPVIDHRDWQKYELGFKAKQDYAGLDFDAYYAGSTFYRGRILIDNISGIESVANWQERICTGDSIQISALPQGERVEDWQITWKAGKNLYQDIVAPAIWVSKLGIYPVELRKAKRIYQVNLTVIGEECLSNFVLPNVFTPNGDGINDTFTIQGILPDKWQMQIFNRWGKQVFYSEGYQNNWTGNDQSGKEAQTGLYYYTLKDKASERQYKGFVQVLK
jgi:gliding motility-associated-like protein